MADPQIESLTTSKQAPPATPTCPRVADLIHYALGQAHGEDRRRVESHLQAGACSRCQHWFEQAAHFRQEPMLDAARMSHRLANLPAAPPPSNPADQTPIPESSRWQRQAFRELEQRLRMLEEGQEVRG
jgi:hypothetical protein